MSWMVDGLKYVRRKRITISNLFVDLDLIDFPLYVPITEDNQIGSCCLPNGDDIRFTDVDGNLLCAEKDGNHCVVGGYYSGVWHVRVPSVVSETQTSLWCYYGNGNATQQSCTDVWGSDHVLVMHDPSINYDSTTYSNTAIAGSAVQTVGKIAGCGVFSGSNYLRFGNDKIRTLLSNKVSISLWFKLSLLPYTFGRLFSIAYTSLYYERTSSTQARLAWNPKTDGANQVYHPTKLNVNQWAFISILQNSTNYAFGLNGQYASGQCASPYFSAYWYDTQLGAYNNISNQMAHGLIDEVRVSRIARPQEWDKFLYMNHSSGDACLSWGEETYGAHPHITHQIARRR